MKKITFITESMGGGVLSYIRELSNSLCHKAKIYVLYGVREQTPKNLRQLFNNHVTLIRINNFQRSLNPIKDFRAYLEICYWLKQIHSNIIHLNSSKAGALGRVILHHKNQQWFYTPHGYAFLMKDASKLKRLFYYLIELTLAKLGTTTIACGSGEYKIANKLSKNSTYVNNGINTHLLKQYWNNKSNTQDIFFTIGRINFQKNPELFNEIAKRFPNNKFIWCGDGPLKYQLTSPNITITGWLSQDNLFKLIQPYKYFIMPSRWEGLPIALLEAMYFKKCCLATNVTGNKDLLCKNNGYLFTSVTQLQEMFSNNSTLNKLYANRSHNIVVNSYNLKQMIHNYMIKYNLI